MHQRDPRTTVRKSSKSSGSTGGSLDGATSARAVDLLPSKLESIMHFLLPGHARAPRFDVQAGKGRDPEDLLLVPSFRGPFAVCTLA